GEFTKDVIVDEDKEVKFVYKKLTTETTETTETTKTSSNKEKLVGDNSKANAKGRSDNSSEKSLPKTGEQNQFVISIIGMIVIVSVVGTIIYKKKHRSSF
ncbi:MAG: LPXTG cell wall anchor domain-containing protein, partial [Enterococcus lemanii]